MRWERRPSCQHQIGVSDFIPALETTYSDPVFGEADPFFGGQVARKVYADVVKQIEANMKLAT